MNGKEKHQAEMLSKIQHFKVDMPHIVEIQKLAAQATMNRFNAFVAAGFTKDQAFQLLLKF